ncbi:hypothetical protein KO566_10095 [Flavobacteriaceae bacterium XHP0103]|uniref:hypothetical protein n=1 Tax=Marixanthotalea marina TaxID=2844359 RepID=UPI002989D1AB|nr:hypothetical protein [Marixanthotalea marina]MBU3822412.1 hypothetical protein [Marixanthotalea marina]
MMKVLQVSGANAWGGNEQQMIDLIYGLEKLDVTNVLLCVPKSPLHEKAEKLGLNYQLLSTKKVCILNTQKVLMMWLKNLNQMSFTCIIVIL